MNALIKNTMTVLALALSLSLVLGTAISANEMNFDRLAESEIVTGIDRDNCRYDVVEDIYFCKL
ncbi:MAG: hypothetical protein H8E41_06765 [Desulfobulbaceae bacterium]|uniref:Uncharacterized protein n=1 Tax=Candidatus Desulfobia pelagia TaxID=2841692 RepID=A0A8J6NB59_9BACT|nr:hypothetical protein [Candidatus Desulfobia pelagia]